MDRVEILEQSLRCYQAGWWSLVPLLGLGPALICFYYFVRVRTAARAEWNPAERHLWVGLMLAMIGFFVSLALLSIWLISLLS